MGGDPIVVRRGEHGWQVGTEETADLTSAMVLASASNPLLPLPPETRADATRGAQARPRG